MVQALGKSTSQKLKVLNFTVFTVDVGLSQMAENQKNKSCFEGIRSALNRSIARVVVEAPMDVGLKAPEQWKRWPKSVRIDSSLPACSEFFIKHEVRYL